MILGIPIAWLQLTFQRVRFLATIAGITFIVILIFMQLGFQDALYTSATRLHQHLNGDIFLVNSQYNSLTSLQSFPRQRLYQSLGVSGVESVSHLYLQFAKLKNIITGQRYSIYCLGIDPSQKILNLPEVNQNLNLLKSPNRILFDRASRPEFGPIAQNFSQGKPVQLELYNFSREIGHQVEVGGLFTLGPSFGVDGNLIISEHTFFQVSQTRSPDYIDIGIIHLQPGVNPNRVIADLKSLLPEDVKFFTQKDFIKLEQNYWAQRTPIGFVFSLMVVMGFVVGVVVVYQILYSNIASHITQYATLKAMGFKNNYLLKIIFQQALFLAILGYIPGFAISLGLYKLAGNTTQLPLIMTLDKAFLVLVSTILMCWISGFFAMGKLKSAAPADVF